MRKIARQIRFASPLFLLLGLGACGGGGNDTKDASSTIPGGTATGPGKSSLVIITANNAPTATAGPAQAGTGLQRSANSTGSLVAAGLEAAKHEPASWPDLALIARRTLTKVAVSARTGGIAPADAATALISDETACVDGGSESVTWNDADNNLDVSPGDSFTITDKQCTEAGETWNGTMTLDIASMQGDPSLDSRWSFSARFTFKDVSFTDASGTTQLNGSFTITAGMQGTAFEGSLSGTKLTAVLKGSREELRDFLITFNEDENTTAYGFSVKGTYYSDRLGGAVTYDTLRRFRGIGDANPTEGRLKAQGANDSQAFLTALDNNVVRIDVDSDGDGTFEQTINTTWDQLDAQTAF